MKKRKLCSLLAVILGVVFLLSACADGKTEEDVEYGAEQEPSAHDIHKYLTLKGDAEPILYSKISRLDGEVVAYDTEHNLLALRTKDLDVYNSVIETVKVYDLTTESIITEQSVTNDLYDTENYTELEVLLEYPIVRVNQLSYSGGENTSSFTSYYFAKPNSEVIRTTNKQNHELHRFENGLISCRMGDEVLWIDKDMEIVRTVDAVLANGYEIDSFNAEYKGYVYAWNDNSLQIFNRSGLCCASYKAPKDTMIIPFVLNDGDVLIQEQTIVDEYTPCDVNMYGMRYTVQSYLMTFTDGTMTEIDLDFMVADLDTAYVEDHTLPFDLAEGRQNKALILRFANEATSNHPELVVMDNDLKIEYTLKNTTPGIQINTAYALNANYYFATVQAGGGMRTYLFDLDGNIVSATPESYVNCHYIVSDTTIYDYSMKSIYNYAENGFKLAAIDNASGNIFLQKFNFTTGGMETYLFNATTQEPSLLTDGVDTYFHSPISSSDGKSIRGLYLTTEVGEYSVHTSDGETLLIAYGSAMFYAYEDLVVIHTTFEGKPITYILK